MRSFFFGLALLLGATAVGQITPGWARYPAISPDGNTIVFTYKGNLFRVASSGGTATQLTFHTAHDYKAVWSNDGQQIAFASDRYGNFDVFVMDALGGPAERLTFHSNDEHPFTFSADNASVLFGAVRQDAVSHRQYPTRVQPELYQVPANSGSIKQVLTVPAEDVQVHTDGSFLVYHDKKGYENEFRKHHTSAIARDLWKYDFASDTHTKLTAYKGEDRNPVLSSDGSTVYYLSEASGTFNVHKLALDKPTESTQLTSLKTHPIRSLSIGNGTMAFSYDGEIYTLKEGETPQKVAITIRTQDVVNADKYISINQ